MKRSFWATIRGKLVLRTLLVVTIPLLVVGGVAVGALVSISSTADTRVEEARAELGDDVVGGAVAKDAELLAEDLAEYLDARLGDITTWARSNVLLDAALAGAIAVERAGLDTLSIEEVEAQYAENRQLGSTFAAQREIGVFLNSSPDFKELFFTEEHGYNVAVSNQTSDMVQSDEEWWQTAWDTGLYVGQPEFDESAGVFSIDFAVAMDRGSGRIGVMKGSLDLAVVQTLADEYARAGNELQATVVGADGQLLAETASAHEPSRILNPDVTVANDPNQRLAVLADGDEQFRAEHPDNYSIDSEWIAGYASMFEALSDEQAASQTSAALAPLDWSIVVEQPTTAGFQALVPLETLRDDLRDSSVWLTIVLTVLALVGLALAVLTSWVFSRQISRPIKTLRNAAVRAAHESLPALVANVDELGPDELPDLEPVLVNTGDEVEDLANAFNAVQRTAGSLVAEQARLRTANVASIFVSMGRRNQNLLSRQLEHINAMEQTETDAETLETLFRLDHLATRMRRNAESLLVLAGEDTPRRFRAPVSVRHLIQAAGGEIEEFGRIELNAIDDASVEGGAASDIAHLLAELLENASRFSPPTTRIEVYGRTRGDHGYTLTVVDHGIGLETEELREANHRLQNPADSHNAPSSYLGLFVIGRLARKHDLKVRLADSPSGGITATVDIPASLMAQPSRPAAPVAALDEPVVDRAGEPEVTTETPAAAGSHLTLAPDPVDDDLVEQDHAAPGDADEAPAAEAVEEPTVGAIQSSLPAPPTSGSVFEQIHARTSGEDYEPETLPDGAYEVDLTEQESWLDGLSDDDPPSDDGDQFDHDQTDDDDASPVPGAGFGTPSMRQHSTWEVAERIPDLTAPGSVATQPEPAPAESVDTAAPASVPAFSFARTTVAADPEPPATRPEPAGDELTPSGFRRRRRGQEGAPAVAANRPAQSAAPTAPKPRDAEAVRSSLAMFTSAVADARAEVDSPKLDDTNDDRSES